MISFLCLIAVAEACAVSFATVSVELSAKIEAAIENEINPTANHIKKIVFLNKANIVIILSGLGNSLLDGV